MYVCVNVYMSWYAPGADISPFIKGVIRASALASLLRVIIPAQLTRHMHRLSHQTNHDVIRVSCSDVPMM